MSETTRKPTLRERRHLHTRQELVYAAIEVIGEYGFDGATIDRVADRAGISRGTVYTHYPKGRDDLLRAAYAELGQQVADRTRETASDASDWQAQLLAHARVLLDISQIERVGHFYNVAGPALAPEGAGLGKGSLAGVALIRETITTAQATGAVARDVSPEQTAILLVGALREAAAAVTSGASEASEIEESFIRLIKGLARG